MKLAQTKKASRATLEELRLTGNMKEMSPDRSPTDKSFCLLQELSQEAKGLQRDVNACE